MDNKTLVSGVLRASPAAEAEFVRRFLPRATSLTEWCGHGASEAPVVAAKTLRRTMRRLRKHHAAILPTELESWVLCQLRSELVGFWRPRR